MTRILVYTCAGLAVLALVLGLYARVKGLQVEVAEVNAAAFETAFQVEQQSRQRAEAAAEIAEQVRAERDAQINEISRQRDAMRRRWQEALQNDQAARNWADTPLPDAVLELLRQESGDQLDRD